MSHDPQPLDYESARLKPRPRPRRLISHSCTAACLSFAALWVDMQLRFDAGEARRVAWIEGTLAAYGVATALLSFVRGGLRNGDRPLLLLCLAICAITAYVGTLMPRVIHN